MNKCWWCDEFIKENQTACGLSVVRVGPNNSAQPCGINIVYHVRCYAEMMPRKPGVEIIKP